MIILNKYMQKEEIDYIYKILCLLFGNALQFFKTFLLGYICCTGGIHSYNSKYTYIVYWLVRLFISLPQYPTALFKAIARAFIVMLCIGSPSNMFPHHNLLFSTSPTTTTPYTHFTYFKVLSFIINF
jgi:hypothetical protein